MGGGLELEAHSTLPVGSGLGTSSILGGAIILAVSRAVGRGYLSKKNSIFHGPFKSGPLL